MVTSGVCTDRLLAGLSPWLRTAAAPFDTSATHLSTFFSGEHVGDVAGVIALHGGQPHLCFLVGRAGGLGVDAGAGVEDGGCHVFAVAADVERRALLDQIDAGQNAALVRSVAEARQILDKRIIDERKRETDEDYGKVVGLSSHAGAREGSLLRCSELPHS